MMLPIEHCLGLRGQGLFPVELLSSIDACNAARERYASDRSQENLRESWRLGAQLAEMIQSGVEANRPGYNTRLLRGASTVNEILREGCKDASLDNSESCRAAKIIFSIEFSGILGSRNLEVDGSRPESLRRYSGLHR